MITNKDKTLVYGTIWEIAGVLRDKFNSGFLTEIECDFAVVENDIIISFEHCMKEDLRWFGLKVIDSGFNNRDTEIICDYYGGGCGVYFTIEEGVFLDDRSAFANKISECLDKDNSDIDDSTFLIVDFSKNKSNER